jgi:hypothetical protein
MIQINAAAVSPAHRASVVPATPINARALIVVCEEDTGIGVARRARFGERRMGPGE